MRGWRTTLPVRFIYLRRPFWGAASRLLKARKWGRRMATRENSGPAKLMHRQHTRPLLRSGEGKVK
jgi:hypothetical protein